MRASGLCALIVTLCSCANVLTTQQAAEIRAAANAENERAYEAALAQAGLTPADPPGVPQMFEASGPEPPDNVYVTGRSVEGAQLTQSQADFARDADGALWHIDRRPRAETSEPYTVEGCFPNDLGGVAPMEYIVGYALPEGVTIAGRKTVEYRARAIAIHHRDGPCDKGPPRP